MTTRPPSPRENSSKCSRSENFKLPIHNYAIVYTYVKCINLWQVTEVKTNSCSGGSRVADDDGIQIDIEDCCNMAMCDTVPDRSLQREIMSSDQIL